MTQSPQSPAIATEATGAERCETLIVFLRGERHVLAPGIDETIVETVFQAGVQPPVSCLSGSCATCLARITQGSVQMRHNDALTEQEVAMGYVLTCQALPTARVVTVVYEE
jgi:ferredoxin